MCDRSERGLPSGEITTRTALMCAEANRGQRVLPVALDEVVRLLHYVLDDIIGIVIPSPWVEAMDVELVFEVLERFANTISTAETQILRGWCGQLVNAGDVREVKENISELSRDTFMLRIAARIARQFERQERLDELENRLDKFENYWIWSLKD